MNQAITSYSRNSKGEYKLPKLTETDWDQILRNVSIITFIQNIPIGMKYYNNYAIATSTMNKEYVDPEEIYLNANGDEYYHMPYCKQLQNTENMIGYRSIDYVQKSYTQKNETGEYETKYYYKHSNNGTINVNQACYYCLVQKSLYEKDETDEKSTAYNTALARERYVARMSKLPAEVEPSYNIYVEAVDSNKKPIAAGFFIKKPDGTTVDHTGDKAVFYETQKITEDDKDKSYYIEARNDSLDVTIEDPQKDTGNLNTPRETTKSDTPVLNSRSPYKSNSRLRVTIDEYNNNGIIVSYNDFSSDVEYGNGEQGNYTNKNGVIGYDLGTGYINVRLKYEANYTNPTDAQSIDAWANINQSDDLTIVTNLKDITGQVRLKFTNGNATYWSNATFDIENKNTSIYCRIQGDKSWYTNEWNVEVLKVNNESIGTNGRGKVKYYTIKDDAGIKGFSTATNEKAMTKDRTFYLIDDVSIGISTAFAPICQNTDNWFDGYFGSGIYHSTGGDVEKGGQYTISNLKIDVNDNTENAFGLFGWVGKPATIENLKISNIVIDTNNVKGKYKFGGLAGFADAGNYINNVIVENSFIRGSAYVGGIIGYSKKKINNCEIGNTDVSSIGTENVIEVKGTKYNTIYVGGIVGLTEGQAVIDNCKVRDNSKIGEGSISIDGNFSINKDRYYVGGIVGYAENIVKNPTVEESITVKGGAIKGTAWDDKKETYTGGVIGYKDTNQKIDGSFNVRCNVSGHDNVGGIIGFNAGGDISNVSFNGSLQGDGENIGGIVGCNTGGTISNCENTVDINVSGENVGGIVGCNYNANIINCNNNALIKGKQNVGGIAGITYSTTIKSCKNFGNIEAEEGFGPDYWIMWKVYRGTGGIAGKLCTSTVEQSFNSGNVKSTVNVGGIAGLNWCSKVYYSYNKGNIEATSVSGQVGGICGHGSGVDILGCYNIGSIKGKKDLAGIMGSCINDTKYPNIDVEKYKDKYLYLDFTPGEIHNYFKYCYNAGDIKDTSLSDSSAGILGKRMRGFNDISMSITFVECYFLDNVKQEGYKAPAIDRKDSNVHKMSGKELKRQLYNWATKAEGKGGIFLNNNNYIYNTIAPVEEDKGYAGYGVLWWELDNYNRTKFYIGSYYTVKGETPNTFRYKPIGNDHSTTLKIGEKSVVIDDNNKEYFNEDGINTNFHSWTMLIKDGTYNLTASATNYGKATQNNYSINSTTKNKILALLHTGAEKAVLTKSGNVTYNWNYSFEKDVPCKYIFNKTPRAEGTALKNENLWKKEDYQRKTFSYSANFGGSTEEETSNIAQVYLDGLDGFLNKNKGTITYSWDCKRIGKRYKAGLWYWKKGNEEHQSTVSRTIENLDSKCTISIPMQSLTNATSDLDLSYDPETCTVSKADLEVKFKYWIDDNIISKLDTTGVVADYVEKIKKTPQKDNLTYQASFGNVDSGEKMEEIRYSLYTTGEHAKDGDMTAKLNILNSSALNSNNNENVNLTLSWDAKYLGIHVAISEIKFEVEYSIRSGEDGIFRFYNL